jgi:5-hydroxyisourate hydrolase-like protein (transthyretin family)
MSQITNKFLPRVLLCVSALALGFWILTPSASMQDEEAEIRTAPLSNANVSANYQPAPERVSTVRGRIFYGDTGRPLRRAGFILLSSSGMGGGREFSGVTNERGEFEIKNVREGRYFISVSTPGVLSPFSSLLTLDGAFTRGKMEEQMANVVRDFQEIIVTGNGDVDATVTVKRGAAISGRIVYADGEPAAGIRVEVLRKTGGEYSAVVPNISEIFGAILGGGAGGMKTDDRGVFRVAALPAGEYIVRAVENAVHGERAGSGRDAEMLGILGMNPSSMLATYFPNVSDVKQAETIKLEAGQEAPEITITIPDRSMHKVGIIVLNKATRQPLKNVRVSLKAKEGVNSLFSSMPDYGSGTQTDEQGRLNFKEIPTGKYTLAVQPPYSWEEEKPKDANQPKPPKLARAEKEITVEDKDIEDLVVEMNYGAVITGTVNFEKNDTLPPMLFVSATEQEGKISETNALDGSYTREGKPIPKKSGEFKLEGLPNGKFFLSAAMRESSSGGDGLYVKSILYNGKDIAYAPLEIKEGDVIKGVQIILSTDLGKLKGKVARADGSAVVGAKISFVSTNKERWANFRASLFAVTNGDGEFEVSGAPDEYFVVFINAEDESEEKEEEKKSAAQIRREWLERKTSGAEKVTLKAKQTETANFKLP